MRSKSSFKRIRNLLSKPPHFTNKSARKKFQKIEMSIFCRSFNFWNRQQILTPQIVDGGPFSTGNLQKSEFFRKRVPYIPNMSAPATPLKSATLWGSCCLKTTLVVFVAKNCWFYQNLKKIGTTNENWVVRRWGGRNFDRNFWQRSPHQYVANL